MKKYCALSTQFNTHLTDGFKEWKRFDIAYGAPDLY